MTRDLIISIRKDELLYGKLEELNDRLYAIYAAGKAKNVYSITGTEAFPEVIEVFDTYGPSLLKMTLNLDTVDQEPGDFRELFKGLARQTVKSGFLTEEGVTFTKISCT